jgi:hypothetical protein
MVAPRSGVFETGKIEPTQALRRQVTRRNQIVRQRSRLHSHLIPSCPRGRHREDKHSIS